MKLKRIESGAYLTLDGEVRIEDRSGKAPRVWVAEGTVGLGRGTVLASGGTIREVTDALVLLGVLVRRSWRRDFHRRPGTWSAAGSSWSDCEPR